MAKSSKKKRPALEFTFHRPPKIPRTERAHNHISYNISASGSGTKISTATSTIHTALSDPEVLESIPEGNEFELDTTAYGHVIDGVAIDPEYLNHLAEKANDINTTSKLKQRIGDESLSNFVPHADEFLSELIGVDGRGEFSRDGACAHCNKKELAVYECRDCFGREILCQSCMVQCHSTLFLHRIRQWNGSYYEKASLKELGLRLQLGHKHGQVCLQPETCRMDDFIVLDINGIHLVNIDFCGCGMTAAHHTNQLLRAQLFPATVTNPKTAATFRMLEYLEILSYESKLSVFEFYQTLERCTDNTGIMSIKDRYSSLLRMIHEWRHLKMMKRAGRGHSSEGIKGTKAGECAVLCPACPQPEMNMPEGWETVPEPQRFLHTLFVAIDANFRLKRKDVSSDQADPGLNKGTAFFVEETKYKEYLKAFVGQTEPKSSCSRHDAINLSEKSSQGHAATGIGACVCARHDMKRPSSVGDLQRGERYCNMDYIFHSTLKDTKVTTFVISYDIACQWSIHLKERMLNYDKNFFVNNPDANVQYLVPKFHLPAHIAVCRDNFSFNRAKGTGKTEGESPERGWVFINKLATSTREMGPGTRLDTLDSHMNDENWKKVVGLAESFSRKMKAAAKEMAALAIDHDEMSHALPLATTDEWEHQLNEWTADHSKFNPYEVKSLGPTQAAVLKQLAEDEARDIANARDMSLDDRVTPSVLISVGINLEAEQRRLREAGKRVWEHALDRQRTKHQYQLNTLQRKIDTWMSFQQLYFPGVPKLRQSFNVAQATDPSKEIKPYDISLWLPSQIKNAISVPEHLQRIEWRIRYSQAYDALSVVQTQLQVRATMYNHKGRFVRGQRENTRARNTISGVNNKIDAAAEEYNAAYHALEALAPHLRNETKWTEELLPLRREDIRDLSEGKQTKKGKQSQSKRTVSWIWKRVPVGEDEEGEFLTDRLRSEWCQSKARADRASEEVSLLTTEMTRTLAYFEWKASSWKQKGALMNSVVDQGDVVHEGYLAYAERQANMYRDLGNHCRKEWAVLPPYVARMLSIIDDPSIAEPGELDDTPIRKSKYNKKTSSNNAT